MRGQKNQHFDMVDEINGTTRSLFRLNSDSDYDSPIEVQLTFRNCVPMYHDDIMVSRTRYGLSLASLKIK